MPIFGDSSWQLIAMEQKPVHAGDDVFIKFNETELKVNGKSGCNSFFADFERSGSKIVFGTPGSTKMFCGGAMEQEKQLLANLQKVKRYELKYGLLYFFGSGDLLLTFRKVAVD